MLTFIDGADSSKGYEIYGEVRAKDSGGPIVIYNKQEDNSKAVLPDGTLPLSGPSRCILGPNFVFAVYLKEKHKGLEVSNGFLRQLRPYPEDSWFGKPIRAVIPGEHGYVVLNFSLFTSAVQATVEMMLITDTGAPPKKREKITDIGEKRSFLPLVHGTVFARNSNYDLEYRNEYDRKYYCNTLFNVSPDEPIEAELYDEVAQGAEPIGEELPPGSKKFKIPLLRCVVCVPVSSSLIIEADISDSGITNVSGIASFIAEEGASRPPTTKVIKTQDDWIVVKVTWIGDPVSEAMRSNRSQQMVKPN